MFDPIQAYYASAHTPSQGYENLDEENLAQRHGQIVVTARRSLRSRASVRIGKLLIYIGEKLAAENASIELSKETT
jgi:hypothetical protein